MFILLTTVFTACQKDDVIELFSAKETVNRTVLVYMIADNSLNGNVSGNLQGMKDGLRNANDIGHLVIYLDQLGKKPVLFKLTKRSDGSIVEDTIKKYPEQNSVDVTVMKQVLTDAYNAYPAYNYGLVLWSHGYDWVPATRSVKISTRWFGQDKEDATGRTNNFMDITDLSEALSAAPHLDFILFDACLMSSVEVAYQLRNKTDYLIASPTEVVDLGFPYNKIIAPMFSPQKDYKEIAVQYYNFYNEMKGEYRSATIALTKCSEMDKLAAETRLIIAAHLPELSALDLASIQRYNRYLDGDYRDFSYDFASVIKQMATPNEWARFKAQLDNAVLYKASTAFFIDLYIDSNQFSGLGMYVPQTNKNGLDYRSWNTFYYNLDWCTAVGLNKLVD